MKQIYKKIIVVKLLILLLLMQSVVSFISKDYGLNAQNNHVCDKNLEAADEAYYDGEYKDVLRLISLCLKEKNITKDQRLLAYTILSRTFVGMENTEKSKEYIGKILELIPEYLPTIEEETPKYVNTVMLIRKEYEQKKQIEEESGISSWYWIGAGGVAVTATIIAIVSSGDDSKDPKDKPLPEPPEFP